MLNSNTHQARPRPDLNKVLLGLVVAIVIMQFTVAVWGAEPKRSDFLSQLLDEGISFERAGNYKDAMNRFNTMLVVDPNNAEAHYRIGLVYVAKNDPQKALKYMKKATDLSPKNIRLSINLAQQFERYEMLDMAITEYQRIIATGVRDPRIKEAEKYLALASSQSLVKKGETNAALLVLNGLLLEYPEDPGVLFGVGGVYVLLNRIEEAERVMKHLVSKQPENDLVHMNLANIYERTGRPAEALQHLAKVIEHNQSPQGVRLAKFRHGMIAGKEFFKQGKWQDAMAAFDELVKLDPNFTEAIFSRALVFLQLKQVGEAEKIFTQLIEANKGDFSTRLNLATLYGDSGRLNKALEQYDYVIKNDKEGRYRQQAQMRASVIHNELGNEEFKKDDLDRAFYEYSLSTQYYGGFALPWYNRGSVLLRQNKKQEAIQEFVQAVGVDPTNLPSLVKLVTLYEELNRFSDAASIYDTIARLTPNSPEGQFAAKKQPITKARGFWVDKNYTAAQELFDNILADQPNNADAWYFLALMNDERGKLTEAADYMQKAVALRSNNPLIRMQLAGIYEKLEMEELAEEEYRRVLFMGVGAEQGNEVMERLNAVESSLSGFSRRMNYSFSYDSNAAMNDLIPAYELSSALSVGVIYANKFAEDLRFNLQFNPVYTTFHKNNFDFWRLGMNYSMIKGGVDRSWSFNYGSDKIVDIENGKSTSNSGSISVRNSRRIFLPALLGLAPEGMEHDLQPTAVDLFFSVRDAESSENQPLLSVTPSFGVSAAQTLAGGVSGSISYSVATSRNKQHTVKFTTFDDSTVDVFSGRRTQGNLTTVKTFDSRDFEYDSHVMSLGLNRMLRPGLRGAIGGNVGYTNYINVDSIDGEKRRQNLAFGLNLGFSMIMQKNVSLYGSFDWQKMRSNMAINSQVASGVKPLAENLQSTGLGGFSKFTMTIGTQMQF